MKENEGQEKEQMKEEGEKEMGRERKRVKEKERVCWQKMETLSPLEKRKMLK